jgi:ketosteroid isomerase-like protein
MQRLLSVMAWLGAIGCSARTPSTRTASDTAAVRAAIDSSVARYITARQIDDAAASAEVYTQDAVLMVQGAQDVRGRAALVRFFEDAPRDSASDFRREAIFVHGDRAYDAWHGSGIDTKTKKNLHFKWILFWRRDADGIWRIERDLTADDATPEK